ncbi:MAG: FTR1 family protein [Phenylobacterium sp.]|uniref:FTR1 family protein n=1 Tax=Phenylobacterium sp. TaxID=1871053 RepID=UPI0025FADE37|nr:FTR1 family protein [Phenylobacterium sp.]MBT9470803.1 FTR1 family protein [Phenylobacterium sp.]
MTSLTRCLFALVALFLVFAPQVSAAEETAPSAQVAWRLLDYLAVDYSGAVSDGRVISQSEYAEMKEFSGSVRERLAGLPPSTAQPQLVREADDLVAAIGRKAPAVEVAARAHKLGAGLLAAYPTPLAPAKAPDLARAAALYSDQCAACHGANGLGDGPNAKGLDPKPVAFADIDRARQRSTFGLYQVIGQGLDGTAMPSFAQLPSDDRWALAFYVGRLAFADAAAKQGERLWNADSKLRARFPNLQALTQITPEALAAQVGEPQATQVIAYLRRHPAAVVPQGTGSLSIARAKLARSLAAYEAGDRRKAQELALAAYLDGFEPVEPALTARDGALMARVETAMGGLRASLSKGARVAEVRTQVEHLGALLDASERALAPETASSAASFAGAFTVLLREGLEALLIVVAMIAFLGKADRRDVLPYVHAGWVSALAAGALTWAAATYLISISGASRELTEGFGSLISAVVLISVGVWMHGKGQADAWQTYIKEKLSAALSRRSAWFLFLLAFVVVYREVFETILFYAALWSQGGHSALLAGAGAAVAALALIAWALLSYSRRLPISQFFSYSSLLIAVLAVVLAGKGVAALQEAGLIDIRPLAALPRIEVLGVFPTWESFGAQLLTLAAIMVGFWLSGRKALARA